MRDLRTKASAVITTATGQEAAIPIGMEVTTVEVNDIRRTNAVQSIVSLTIASIARKESVL